MTMTQNDTPLNWWMFGGSPSHDGFVGSGSQINSQTVGTLAALEDIQLNGPILHVAAIVNDVVFCATTHVSLYAFNVMDGSVLWQDTPGSQTLGLNGGYGVCFGAAIDGNDVVAGALIRGRDGGVLPRYTLKSPAKDVQQ